MTTEEKVKRLCEILLNCYSNQEQETFEIRGHLLRSCGFDVENRDGEFWNIICPRLKNDGILKDYNPLGRLTDNAPEMPRIPDESYTANIALALYGEIMDEDEFYERQALEKKKKLGAWIKECEDYTIFTFTVNSEKLKASQEKNNTKDTSTTKKEKLLHEFPHDIKWENITIRFLNGHEVIIDARGNRLQTDYKEMGFEDKKTGLPDAQWQLLQLLGNNNGEITWNDALSIGIREPAALRQRKKKLSDTLKNDFPQIKEEPFDEVKRSFLDDQSEKKMYRIKINLVSESQPLEDSKTEWRKI